MINGTNQLSGLGKTVAGGVTAPKSAAPEAGSGASFSDLLKSSIDEVSRLQQDASRAVEDLATGRTDNISGVMSAMEKADLAFKTLLAIRAKLMEAYDEVKTIQI